MASKQVRISDEDHAFLQIIAGEEKRSVTAQLSIEIQKLRKAWEEKQSG